MEFKKVVGRLRDTRLFLPWKPVEREKIQKMLEAARLSSRAVNVPFGKAVVTYRDWLTEEERDTLKTPMASVEYDLAPVYVFWYHDMDAVGVSIREKAWPSVASGALQDAGALNPSHGWSRRYVEEVILPEVLTPGLSRTPQRGGDTDAAMAMEVALLCAIDEGLGACLVPFDEDGAKRLLGVPDTWEPLMALLVGYPAEAWEGMGQSPVQYDEETAFEGDFSTPFRREEAVLEKLRAEGMLHNAGPMPWRKKEIQALARMFGLPDD
ncbi:MAG: nitroreductase family protein [Dehalococcoidia bacterium]